MEADLKEWMRHLFAYLELKSPLIPEAAADVISPLDATKAAVCEILNLFIQVNEEDFEEYVEQFVASVWKVLSAITLHPAQVRHAHASIVDDCFCRTSWLLQLSIS